MRACKGCMMPSTEAWCERCTGSVWEKLRESLELAKAARAEQAIERKDKFLAARVSKGGGQP